jgi:hypothetical protein
MGLNLVEARQGSAEYPLEMIEAGVRVLRENISDLSPADVLVRVLAIEVHRAMESARSTHSSNRMHDF